MIISSACRATVNGEKNVFPVLRHSHFYEWMKMLHCDYNKAEVEQGFLNWDPIIRKTYFVNRVDALKIARECNQIINEDEIYGNNLYSEALWP